MKTKQALIIRNILKLDAAIAHLGEKKHAYELELIKHYSPLQKGDILNTIHGHVVKVDSIHVHDNPFRFRYATYKLTKDFFPHKRIIWIWLDIKEITSKYEKQK